MRRRPGLAVLVMLVALAAAGCHRDSGRAAPTPTAAPAATAPTTADDPWAKGRPAAAIDRPFLWSATRDGQTTYLLGTLHMGVNADAQLPAWLKAKLDGARTFAMEADISNPSLMTMFQRTDGGSLRLDLGPAHWAKLEAAIGANVASGVDKMKPFAVMSMLATRSLPQTLPMDSVLQLRAKSAGKPIVYLEDAQRQLAMIEPFMTAADIKAFLDNLDYAKTQTEAMLAAYVAGDEVALAKQFDDQTLWLAAGRPADQFAAYVEAILGSRNQSWIAGIEQLHAAGGGFVAVGAGHLVGPHNVLGMLAARGFTITRVTGP